MAEQTLEQRVAALEQTVESLQRKVTQVLENSDDQPLIEQTEELKNEIDRRVAAADAEPSASIPWVQVNAEALARLHKK